MLTRIIKLNETQIADAITACSDVTSTDLGPATVYKGIHDGLGELTIVATIEGTGLAMCRADINERQVEMLLLGSPAGQPYALI